MNEEKLSLRGRFVELLDATTHGLPLQRERSPHSVWRRCRELLKERFNPRSLALVIGNTGPSPPDLFFRTGLVELPADDADEVTVETSEFRWDAPWPPWSAMRPDPILDPAAKDAVQPGAQDIVGRLDAQLWIPLHLDLRTVGLLSLGPREAGEPYSNADRFYLQWLARHLEVALGNAVRNRQRQAERRRLDRSVHTLALLLDVSRALSAAHQLRSVLELILEGAMETVSARKASLALFDPKDDTLRVHLVKGLPDALLEEAINAGRHECLTFRPGEGIAGRVFKNRQPILLTNARADARFAAADRSFTDSIVCVPLIADGEAIGVLNVTNPATDRSFDASDQDHLQMLATQAAGAINRARLYELASTDELTGLYVRRLILQRLQQEVRRFRRYGRAIAVAVLDLDHFKRVNDTYGHAAGDEVLRTLGQVLLDKTRRDLDIPGRIGGEEFLLIMPETNEDGAHQACDRLRRAIEAEPIFIEDEEIRITVSIGVAARESGEESSTSMLRRADKACYEAKAQGRNRVVVAPRPSADSA